MNSNTPGGPRLMATAQLKPNPDVTAMGEKDIAATALAFVGGGVPAIHARTEVIVIQILGANVRFTDDGTAPTAGTHGFLIYDGTTLVWSVQEAMRARFIRDSSTTAKLKSGEYLY